MNLSCRHFWGLKGRCKLPPAGFGAKKIKKSGAI